MYTESPPFDSSAHEGNSNSFLQQPQSSFVQRINHLEKRKSMEVSIPGTNPMDAMFAHQDCGMGVVQEVAGQMGKLGKDLSGDLGMP